MVVKWRSLSVQKFKVEVYKDGEMRAFFIFNGKRSVYKNWFAKGRLLASSFEDLYSRRNFNYFSIDGHQPKRRFFINKKYKGCPNDIGWFVVLDDSIGCPWEKQTKPAILYGKNNQKTQWQVSVQNRRGDLAQPRTCIDAGEQIQRFAYTQNNSI
ncbi:hypothetical protein KUTeg_007908 [Tegillarca granosa]|uniref:Uncharacterized protein n=1 Tax=Tegillarca granosa TaxID=220873 RepID=A0ABQ9FEK0_TEGGR|nr:hypothetical protein KUTeg_007908 [Tegillarca granosa]